MDNLCHTLVGAAMGYAGLRRKSALGNATLMIAANLPDLDVLVFATGTPAIEFRRGWTHGILAQALLPVALTAVMAFVGRGRNVHAGWLLLLSYVGVYSHVFLDFLNNYGVRLLAPFDWRWFYGDAVFIMDPWLWLTLGVGIVLSRRRASSRPAQVALVIASVYVLGMLIAARGARETVRQAWEAQHGVPPRALMVGPVPVTPFVRQVIVDAGDRYQTGSFSWPPPRVSFDGPSVPKHDGGEIVRRARAAPPLRSFLVWSRFPFYRIAEEAGGTRVSVGDMRFVAGNPLGDALGRGRFTVTTVVPRQTP